MDDVAGIFGEPVGEPISPERLSGSRSTCYRFGPEGTHELNFTHSDEGGPVDAAELGSRRITGFSAQYAS